MSKAPPARLWMTGPRPARPSFVNRMPTPDLATYQKVVASLPDGEVAWLFAYRSRPGASFLAKLVVDRGRGKK